MLYLSDICTALWLIGSRHSKNGSCKSYIYNEIPLSVCLHIQNSAYQGDIIDLRNTSMWNLTICDSMDTIHPDAGDPTRSRHKIYLKPFFCSSVFISVCVFMCAPRELFFFQCCPETPKDWTPLIEDIIWSQSEKDKYHMIEPNFKKTNKLKETYKYREKNDGCQRGEGLGN